MPKLLTVEDNSAPPINLTLKRKVVAEDGDISYAVIDLTDASTVELIIRRQRTKTITNDGHQTCSIIDADAGEVRYQPEATDWPEKGLYAAEAKITYIGGRYEIIYEQLKIKARKKLVAES
jgi:hypothetical protein